jgi:hypothetical protein
MISQAKLLEQLKDYCGNRVVFTPGESYYWSPQDRTVYYQADDASQIGLWTLFHEACHGILEHKNYLSDFELVLLEVEAWKRAEKLASDFGLMIDPDHVQDCLDSYRDWQYKRSLCPRCDLGGVQLNQKTYSCVFCHDSWHVSKERFFRPYRLRDKK